MDIEPAGTTPPVLFADVYAEHAALVWRSLKRMGVRDADLEDACQETFLVVHAKLDTFRGGSIRGWLFAIAVRVAADYRKRAAVRYEVLTEEIPESSVGETQTGAIERAQAAALLRSALSTLDEDKRAVFVLYELEEVPMVDVARALECPVQTAYSRLHAARDHVASTVARWKTRQTTPQISRQTTNQRSGS
ncbi:MAG TPA: sigma-70 family RNA polymerase sigma factor [Labilithrix sp.]|nr:sigma-70 family RNA polymerase sigma factor [Labilithrix sp.]